MEGDKFHTGLNEVWTLKKINEPNVIKIVMNQSVFSSIYYFLALI